MPSVLLMAGADPRGKAAAYLGAAPPRGGPCCGRHCLARRSLAAAAKRTTEAEIAVALGVERAGLTGTPARTVVGATEGPVVHHVHAFGATRKRAIGLLPVPSTAFTAVWVARDLIGRKT